MYVFLQILTGTWINGIGCVIRLLPSFVFGVKTRFWVALVGQVIAACSQPIILSIPTKLAALWFADNERTLANTMASLCKLVLLILSIKQHPFLSNIEDCKDDLPQYCELLYHT